MKKTINQLTKSQLYAVLTGIFTASLIISNILAFKVFSFGKYILPAAVIMFPIVYIINDVLSEIYGYTKAKMAILTGFVMNLVAVIAYTIAIKLPAPIFFEGQSAFAMVLSTSFRVLVASLLAYLAGGLVNAKVLVKMKESGKGGMLARFMASTFFGEFLDSIIFITIAFGSSVPIAQIPMMIIVQASVKTLYEAIMFPITKRVVLSIQKLKD